MVGRKFKGEVSGPARRAAELSLREGKQKSILLREAEFEQSAGRARNFSYHIGNYFQHGLQIRQAAAKSCFAFATVQG
jgi:hypothetical protein